MGIPNQPLGIARKLAGEVKEDHLVAHGTGAQLAGCSIHSRVGQRAQGSAGCKAALQEQQLHTGAGDAQQVQLLFVAGCLRAAGLLMEHAAAADARAGPKQEVGVRPEHALLHCMPICSVGSIRAVQEVHLRPEGECSRDWQL